MKRPRLAPHVLARRHRVGSKQLVVLHDTRADAIGLVGEREWTALRAADGTRDASGIAAACAAEGRPLRAEHLSDFLGELERAGMLREGIVEPPHEAPQRPKRPRLSLEGFALRCDGGGTCCRIYPTTAFSPLEVARAQSLTDDPEARFTPEHGSTFYPWLARAVGMVEGRCAYLATDGGCVLHRLGGKPSGCRMYPAVFVDDGQSVRVSPAPECRCVLASARGACDGAPLVEEAAAHVETLPDRLPLTADRLIERERATAICDAIDAAAPGRDAVELLEEHGRAFDDHDELARIARRLDAFNAQNGWRSESDFARAVPLWMRAALERRDGTRDEEGERFYVRALAFGRLWLRDGEAPLATALRRRAARLWIARRLRAVIDRDHPLAQDRALDEPIALVEAVCRSFGL